MKRLFITLGATLAIVAAGQAADTTIVLQPLMKNIVAPQAAILWDVGNRGMDDDGHPDVSKLTGTDWDNLAGAAQAMKDASTRMATAPHVMVAAAGTELQDGDAPGAATAQQIQGFIDHDPKAFSDHAQALAAVSDVFLQAASARDAAKLFAASGKLDEVCEGCHIKYWYPQQ